MNYRDRIAYLEESHRVLEKKLTELVNAGGYDEIQILDIKKRKLSIKDEISRLRRLEWEDRHETVDYDDDR